MSTIASNAVIVLVGNRHPKSALRHSQGLWSL